MTILKTKTQAPAPEPKRGRGRPKGSKATKKPKVNSSNPQANPPGSPHGEGDHIYNNINNINKGMDSKSNNDCSEVLNKQDDIDIKAQMTLKELKFMELVFSGEHTIEKSMRLAGYTAAHKTYLYVKAKKIVKKYERGAGGAGKIFRDIGFGQVKVAQGIAAHAEHAESEAVSLNALALVARCLGMTEPREGAGNQVLIQINTGPAAAPEPAAAGAPVLVVNANGQPVAPAAPRKPLQITR